MERLAGGAKRPPTAGFPGLGGWIGPGFGALLGSAARERTAAKLAVPSSTA